MNENEEIIPGGESAAEAESAGKLEQLQSAYEKLQQQYEELKQSSILEKVSSETGCTDPEYLHFRAARQGITLTDPEALRKFAGELAAVSPGCFRARITPGSSGGLPAASPAVSPAAEERNCDRIGRIAFSIDHAPDAGNR